MTTEIQKYNQVFTETFSIAETELAKDPTYNQIPNWDSIGHMSMIATLEEKFGISMETDDIINFSSYTKGMEILGKYGINLSKPN